MYVFFASAGNYIFKDVKNLSCQTFSAQNKLQDQISEQEGKWLNSVTWKGKEVFHFKFLSLYDTLCA